MLILRILLKGLLLPVLAIVVLLQWIGIFLNSISSVVFGILSFAMWSIALLSLVFGQSTGGESIRMIIIAFVVFIIPPLGDWLIERIVVLRVFIGDFMRS